MRLNNKKVYKILKEMGIDYLYHANTVATSGHFIMKDALLSREKMNKLGLSLTSQYSDDDDKGYGIYNDIFLDSCDIHSRGKIVNDYGPVLFVFKTEIINSHDIGEIWITKDNPTNWDKFEEDEYWFKDLKEVKDIFGEFEFCQMLVLRNCKGKLLFDKYIEKIIIDNPERNYPFRLDTCAYAMGALRHAYSLSPKGKIDFEIRKCSKSCGCKTVYKSINQDTLKKLFSPLST